MVEGSFSSCIPSPSRSTQTVAPTRYPSIACPLGEIFKTLIVKGTEYDKPPGSVATKLNVYELSAFTSPGEEKLGDALKETLPSLSTENNSASSPEREYDRESPSTSVPVKVKSVVPPATLSNISTVSAEATKGASLTAATINEMVALLEIVLSTMLKTRFPIVSASLFTFSLGVKVMPSRSASVRLVPTASIVPDAKVKVPPEGIASTVIEKESEVSPVAVMLNELAVSSVKSKLWLVIENDEVGVGGAGVLLPPPPPPPQEANVRAVKFANKREDFPLS